ncbi:hypothetical protein MLD38_027733 [Melastoma candidum]|nr:hypothetical protein MLD38_027733 [Melastoma candidum]
MRFQGKYVRRSRDWVGNRWVDLKSKPEILTFLTANPCNSFESSLCSIVRSTPEEIPSILGTDVLSPSKDGLTI